MSSIPVVILGLKRANYKALSTKKHFKKNGFKNVSIFYGLDIKGSNPEKVKSNQVVGYNNLLILEKNKDKSQLLIAEDDARITKPKELMTHLNKGIKGVDRLIWNYRFKDKGSKKLITQNAGLIGYDNSGINRALSLSYKDGHWDLVLSRKLSERASGPYGIEYLYPSMKKKGGVVIGLDEHHKKQKKQEKISDAFDKGEEVPLSFKRYKN